MTIWKAIARLIDKLTDSIPTKCKHDWFDYQAVSHTSYGKQVGRSMTQRCSKCAVFRNLKIFGPVK